MTKDVELFEVKEGQSAPACKSRLTRSEKKHRAKTLTM